jgi:hypothetical protein
MAFQYAMDGIVRGKYQAPFDPVLGERAFQSQGIQREVFQWLANTVYIRFGTSAYCLEFLGILIRAPEIYQFEWISQIVRSVFEVLIGLELWYGFDSTRRLTLDLLHEST